ncbi:MAG TPA: hypothetical protein VMQ76_00635 [Terracidiphilus sp.]|nr:hypothetical protein [Terracidiphilus sp.]
MLSILSVVDNGDGSYTLTFSENVTLTAIAGTKELAFEFYNPTTIPTWTGAFVVSQPAANEIIYRAGSPAVAGCLNVALMQQPNTFTSADPLGGTATLVPI